MMRLATTLVIILLCSSVSAEHHRGHAVVFLDSALVEMEAALFWATSYRDRDAAGMLPADQKAEYDAMRAQHAKDRSCPYTTLIRPLGHCIARWVGNMRATYPKAEYPEFNSAYDHIFLANKYDIYASKYLRLVQSYRTNIAAGVPLPDIRGTIHSSGMGEGNKESGLWGFVHSESNIAGLVRPDSPNFSKVKRILLVHRKAVGELLFALWHHYDGTFEEVYKDPAFICSGPGNHCP